MAEQSEGRSLRVEGFDWVVRYCRAGSDQCAGYLAEGEVMTPDLARAKRFTTAFQAQGHANWPWPWAAGLEAAVWATNALPAEEPRST